MDATVVLTGAGNLGGPLLDRLALIPGLRTVVVTRNAREGEARCNLARMAAGADDVAAALEHRVADLRVSGELAAVVDGLSPDLVVHTASLQTWWLLDLFPDGAPQLRRAGFGAWLPVHLVLAMRAAAELEAAGFRGPVVNAAYPDVVNTVLAGWGSAPTIGIGNVDELAVKLRVLAARRLAVAPQELEIALVAHHSLQTVAFADGQARGESVPPYHLSIRHEGREVSDIVESRRLLLSACELPPGPAWGAFTAASGARLIEALLGATPRRLHAPGPEGLPGGYPVEVVTGSVEIIPPAGLTIEEAVLINERSHRFDGIERIEEDGSVVLCEGAADAMRAELGYDCDILRPEEAEERAAELGERFRAYATRHRVDLGAAIER